MTPSFRFDLPQHFTAGTVGPRGQRTFYLQFGNPGELVALKLEKGQVGALADFLEQLIDELDPISDSDTPLALDLIEPVEAEWVVASIGVAYQEESDTFIVVAEEFVPEADEPDPDEPATAQLQVTRGQVQAFINRAHDLMEAGRPPCEYCGRPLDHDDGWCPCHN